MADEDEPQLPDSAPQTPSEAPPEPVPAQVTPEYISAPMPADDSPYQPRRPEPEVAPVYGPGDFDAALEARGDTLGDRLGPTVIYVLLVAGALSFGVTAVPAAWLAYRGKLYAPDWIRSHYVFQIRTFWIGTVMSVIGALTFLFLDQGVVGVIGGALWGFILIFGVLWYVLRLAVGLGRLRHGEPIWNPTTWLI